MRRLLCSFVMTALLASTASAATVDGIKIHSSATGTGKNTLIFIHGWTCDSTSWSGQVPTLSKTYRVITLDLPGHGQSGSPSNGQFSMDLFARAVEAVRSEAKAGKVVLVGHSMGAPVIRQYARLYPQHVAALVAVDGPLDLRAFDAAFREPPKVGGPEGLKIRENLIRSMFTPKTPAALQQQILKMMLSAPESTATGAMAAVFDPAIRKADVTPTPALAIYAGTAMLPNIEETRKVLPKFEATKIADTGHFLMMERPDEFNKQLTVFLAKITF
jgi:pimeloyl-ACP methyl ester carboxylesterase